AARQRGGGPPAPVVAAIRTLPDLLESVAVAGVDVRPVLLLQDLDRVPTVLDRAVYRIVQEALTNAMKHASGVPVAVDVRVSAHAGVRVLVSNPFGSARHGGTERSRLRGRWRPQVRPARVRSARTCPAPEAVWGCRASRSGRGCSGARRRWVPAGRRSSSTSGCLPSPIAGRSRSPAREDCPRRALPRGAVRGLF